MPNAPYSNGRLGRNWSPFVDGDTTYDLGHLHEYTVEVLDSAGASRCIAVTFEDHCFTRQFMGTSDTAPVFPGCSRGPDGRFCLERYELSLGISKCIGGMVDGVVWNTDGEHYASVTIARGNSTIRYAIVFSLDKVKGIEGVDLHMRVRTAHPRDEEIATFGSVRFRRLIRMRVEGKRPNKEFGSNRKRPK